MLSKSRVFSILLFGLGIALVVAGLLAPRFVHVDARLPLNLEQKTWTLHDDSAQTRLISDPNGRVLDSPVTKQLHLEVQNPADERLAALRVGETLMRDSYQSDLDRLITATVWSFVIDRDSAVATTVATVTDQMASPVSETVVDGYWLKYPAGEVEEEIAIFDSTLRQARPAQLVETIEMEGREVNHYRQEIAPINVATLYRSWLNTTTFEGEEDPRAFLFHSVSRDVFVDKISGLVVEIREDIDDYYGNVAGEKKAQVLAFEGRMSAEQISAHLAQAAEVTSPAMAQTWRWIFVAAGAVLALLGLLGSYGAFRVSKNQSASRG